MVDEWPVPDSFLTGLFEIETSTILDAARGIGRHQEIRRGKRANCGLARTRQPGPGRIASSTARIRHLFSAAFVDQVPGGLDRRERSRYDWIIPANSTLPFQKTFRFFNRLKGIRPGLRSNVGLGGCVPPQPKKPRYPNRIAGFLISAPIVLSLYRKHTASGVKPSRDARSRPVRAGVEDGTNGSGRCPWREPPAGNSGANPTSARRASRGEGCCLSSCTRDDGTGGQWRQSPEVS